MSLKLPHILGVKFLEVKLNEYRMKQSCICHRKEPVNNIGLLYMVSRGANSPPQNLVSNLCALTAI